MKDFTIVAGPCSIDYSNMHQAIEIGRIPEVDGVRCVGLKSVTSPRPFMGIDKNWFFKGQCMLSWDTPPSAWIGAAIIQETGKFIAMEMMDIKQLEVLDKIEQMVGNVFVWNPAINQLGYPMYKAAEIAKRNSWKIGLKNPKFEGRPEVFEPVVLNSGEKNWLGNAKFVEEAGVKPVMIQRGVSFSVSAPVGNLYRNYTDHTSSISMKEAGYEVWLDPSHICGTELRDSIHQFVLDSLIIKIKGEYLYSGLLIEVGTSQTDTGQHLTIKELKALIQDIKIVRNEQQG